MKPPVADVVIVVPENEQLASPVGVCTTPLSDTVALELTEKPEPVTVYVAPAVPPAGTDEIVTVVTRKDVELEAAVPEIGETPMESPTMG